MRPQDCTASVWSADSMDYESKLFGIPLRRLHSAALTRRDAIREPGGGHGRDRDPGGRERMHGRG